MKMIKIYKVGDDDWIAAESPESAVAYMEGLGEATAADPWIAVEVTDAEMESRKIRDEDEPDDKIVTWKEYLAELLADPAREFPMHFTWCD